MRFLEKVLDFYIFSNTHVAIAGFCLTKITLLKYGINDSLTAVFVALSIIISYNFIRLYEIKGNRLFWFKNWYYKHRIGLLMFCVLISLLLVYVTFFSSFNLNSLVLLFPFAFMTLFYVLPLFKIGKKEVSFRNFPSIKIFSIAISWAGITVLFPLYEAGYEFVITIYIEFFQRFLILIVLTLPFDIRDVNIDSKTLRTLPQVFGVRKSKSIGYVLLLAFVFLEVFEKGYANLDFYILLIISLVSAVFLRFSFPNKNRYYTSFWVESIPILWFGLIVLF